MNDDQRKQIPRSDSFASDDDDTIASEEIRLKALIKAEAERQALGLIPKAKGPESKKRRTRREV